MGHYLKIKCVHNNKGECAHFSFNKFPIYSTVQVPNLALTDTKRITVNGIVTSMSLYNFVHLFIADRFKLVNYL